MVGAVWFSAGIRWRNREGTGHVTKMASHRVVRDADHDAVLGANAVISWSYSCKRRPYQWVHVKLNKPAVVPTVQTKSEQPVSFADDAADASWVDVPHELPQQGTEWRLCSHQLFHVRDANTDWFLCWSVLEVTCREVKNFFFFHYIC